ncbi:MAG TPA: amidohydrolase family protein [Acidimicrobiales bacterium]|nr:amidohydrolase family protein [Acidimicrobiales bacterium]
MQEDSSGPDRYVVISSDCHAGADLPDYKPYLEARWHEEFDAWAGTYVDSWADIDSGSEWKAGVSSFMSPLNWDSSKRLEALETEGIVAEVIFPNTVPPFFPNGLLAAPGPRTREEYERRFAGVRAHNRWLKDFCDEAPGRRLGVAQLFIDDVDDAVEEIRWAKEAGMAQVLLPSDHHLKLHNLYYASLDPIWSVCEELDMPIGRHGAVVGSDVEPAAVDAAHAVGVYETLYFGQRTIPQLVLSGVFERHPNLKFVFTELGTGTWLADTVTGLDGFVTGSKMPGTVIEMFAGKATAKLSRLPSEYCRDQVYLGVTVTPSSMERRHEIGLDRMMWGADFPHHEGTAPYTLKALRGTLAGHDPADIRQILSGTAADLYGADLGLLQAVADRVGPSIDEVATSLRADEMPDDPNFAFIVEAYAGLSNLVGQKKSS